MLYLSIGQKHYFTLHYSNRWINKACLQCLWIPECTSFSVQNGKDLLVLPFRVLWVILGDGGWVVVNDFLGCPALNCRCVSNGFHPRLGEKARGWRWYEPFMSTEGKKVSGVRLYIWGATYKQATRFIVSNLTCQRYGAISKKVGCDGWDRLKCIQFPGCARTLFVVN